MVDLADVSTGDLITAARQNLINDYIQDGTHKIDTLSVSVGGTEVVSSARALTNITGDITMFNAGVLTTARGGTGRSSHTVYAVICGGTGADTAQQSIASVGDAGQVLTSNGAGALPTFETPATPDADKIIEGDTSIEVVDTGSDGKAVFTIDGTAMWHLTNDGHFQPQTDDTYDIGDSTHRIGELWVTDSHVGDIHFMNDWRITEFDETNTMFDGLRVMSKKNEEIFKITPDGVYFRGKKMVTEE